MRNKINDGGAAVKGYIKGFEDRAIIKRFIILPNGGEFPLDEYVGVERIARVGQSGMDVNIILSNGNKKGVHWFRDDGDAAEFVHSLHGEIRKIREQP